MKPKGVSQKDFILSYYENDPNREIPHAEIVAWALKEWQKLRGKPFADPDRAIRKLHGERRLIKVKKGVYRYNPNQAEERVLTPFTAQQKKAIFARDGYKCVVCGRGKAEGHEIQADHIRPQELGGESIIENGQTLCATHNYRKGAFNQTETGKKMFIRFYEFARKSEDKKLAEFCRAVLKVYDEHDINGHIKWDKKS